MEKVGSHKSTIWTATASDDVPSLDLLDTSAPVTGQDAARKRAEQAKLRTRSILAHYAARSSAASLRKRVK